jgi:HEAT repeat protein
MLRTSFIAIVIFCMLPLCGLAQQVSAPANRISETPQSVVNDVIASILKRGAGRSGGYAVKTWVPPSDSDLRSIRDLGQAAIPPLDVRVDDPDPFVQLLAVRFLGEIGGSGTVVPLRRALSADRWSFVRTQSMTSLINAPDGDTVPILKGLVSDQDGRVRDRARALLRDHYHVD